MSAAGPVLVAEKISKRYPGVDALTDVTIEVGAHEVVGLIGENGSGKSTLLKILAGVERPDSGRLLVNGGAVQFRSAVDAHRVNISMVFQEQSLIPTITVAENIVLGDERDSTSWGVYRWKSLRERAEVQLAKLGLDIPTMALTGDLSFAQRQMVELAKALAIEERGAGEPIILLDEPTSVLDGDEITALFEQIERIRQSASIVFVSHRLDEVIEAADRVYVLRDGRCAAQRPKAKCYANELYGLMIGRKVGGEFYAAEGQVEYDASQVVLAVQGLTIPGAFRDVSFEVHAGEVLGIAGVIGSGREELARALFGAVKTREGRLEIDGTPVRIRSPRHAVQVGLGYVPSERRLEGIAVGLTVAENMVLAFPEEVCTGPFLHPRKWKRAVESWMQRLRVRAPSGRTRIDSLSGGNQQKVVLAKWLLSDGLRVLVLDHPTRGLDIGAKEDVYALIRDLSHRGMAFVVLADTLEETIGLSHNVVVMKDGEVTARIPAPTGGKPAQVDVLRHMV